MLDSNEMFPIFDNGRFSFNTGYIVFFLRCKADKRRQWNYETARE
jgi:hypothetical protein